MLLFFLKIIIIIITRILSYEFALIIFLKICSYRLELEVEDSSGYTTSILLHQIAEKIIGVLRSELSTMEENIPTRYIYLRLYFSFFFLCNCE